VEGKGESVADWDDELTALATRRGTALVGYAYLLCGNRRDAEDLVQDALVKVFSRLRKRGPTAALQTAPNAPESGTRLFRLDDAAREDSPSRDDNRTLKHVEGYVRSAILTIYLDGYRRRRHWFGLRHLVAQRDSTASPESPAGARADTAKALARLTPRQRACVVLRYYEDLTVPRIAEELGCADGTVKRHLADAMTAMQQALGATPRDPGTTDSPGAAPVTPPTSAPLTTGLAAAPRATPPATKKTPSTTNGRNIQ
jgi:RNA polymerase sigma factor (sigma-70 family)